MDTARARRRRIFATHAIKVVTKMNKANQVVRRALEEHTLLKIQKERLIAACARLVNEESTAREKERGKIPTKTTTPIPAINARLERSTRTKERKAAVRACHVLAANTQPKRALMSAKIVERDARHQREAQNVQIALRVRL